MPAHRQRPESPPPPSRRGVGRDRRPPNRAPSNTIPSHSKSRHAWRQLLTLGILVAATPSTAVPLYWNKLDNGAWGNPTNWSRQADGSDSGFEPGKDNIIFSADPVTGGLDVSLNGDRDPRGITFRNPGSVTIAGGNAISQLLIGPDGIDVESTAGRAVFDSTVTIVTRQPQTWIARDNPGDDRLRVQADVVLESDLEIRGLGQVSIAGDVSGDATLTYSGAGTLRLNGDSTFTSDLLLTNGVTEFNGDGALGAGAVRLDGAILRPTADSLIITRPIIVSNDNGLRNNFLDTSQRDGTSIDVFLRSTVTGTGDFYKLGNGTMTLETTPTMDGVFGVEGGLVTADTTIMPESVLINASGTARLTGTGVYTGRAQGAGTLETVGSVRLDGPLRNTPALTTVRSGTLTITETSLSGPIEILGDSELVFDQEGITNYLDAIEGDGRLLKVGDGTLQFGRNNTYSGGTTIDGGVIQGSTRTLVGDYGVGNGELWISQNFSDDFVGNIAGFGVVRKFGLGNVRLTGNNSSDVTTVVEAGALTVNAATSLRGPVEIAGSGRLIFEQPGGAIYESSITGSGIVRKTGQSALFLRGDQLTHFGGYEIVEGDLNIDDEVNGPVQVFSGGLLGGLGNVNGDVSIAEGGEYRGIITVSGDVMNDGTYAPGALGGPVNVTGDYTQRETGEMRLTLDTNNPSQERALVGGEAYLSGKLVVDLENATPPLDTTFLLLVAQGLGVDQMTAFDSLEVEGFTPPNPLYAPDLFFDLSYVDNGVFGEVSLTYTGDVLTARGDFDSSEAIDANDFRAMAMALYNPTGSFTDEQGRRFEEFLWFFDVAGGVDGAGDGRVDFDDLAIFNQIVSEELGSQALANSMLREAIDEVRSLTVPEPAGLLAAALAVGFAVTGLGGRSASKSR